MDTDDSFSLFKSRGLHILPLNVRSLPNKLDELRCVAHKSKAAIIGITETWLDDSIRDPEIEIPDYMLIRKDRNREGGGVCMYIRSDLAHNKCKDLQHPALESVWVEVLLPRTKPFLVGTCYRPPQTDGLLRSHLTVLCYQRAISEHGSDHDG